MARSPRVTNAPPTTPDTSVAGPSQPIRVSTRHTRKQSTVTFIRPSTPVTPAILTPSDSPNTTVSLVQITRPIPKTYVEPKTHSLRSVGGERERVACPFPEKYGGKDKCGVSDEDEKDETLMALCAALAVSVRTLPPFYSCIRSY